MKEHWKLFLDCKSKDSSLKVASKLFDLLECEVDSVCAELYIEGGYTVKFEIELSDHSWQQNIFLSLSKAQKVAHSWVMTGDIEHELDVWSNNSKVPGVTSLHLQLMANG